MGTLIVSKFGGTSMGDAACMRRSAQITQHRRSCMVAVSATSGTTNDLIALGQAAQSADWKQSEILAKKIRDRHLKIADDLHMEGTLRSALSELLAEMDSIARGIFLLRDGSPKAMDTLMSLGERMSSWLFVQALREVEAREVRWLDAREVLKTDDQFGKAKPLPERIYELCQARIVPAKKDPVVYVTQGFIGSTEDGATTTLGRGGSDYSAALLAEGIGADVLEIWTDVPGIATTDPRICPEARPLPELSFKEASELATFGAKVLHPATLLPALRKNIPVFVGSSFDPEERGTWVRLEARENPLLRAIALRKKQVLVTLTTPEMLQAHGFLAKIFRVFDQHRISIDAITTSEISVALTLDDSALLNKGLITELNQFAEVQIEENLTLVALVGNGLNHAPGIAAQIFDKIKDVNVRMICHGASKHNLCFLVGQDQGEEVVRRLHPMTLQG